MQRRSVLSGLVALLLALLLVVLLGRKKVPDEVQRVETKGQYPQAPYSSHGAYSADQDLFILRGSPIRCLSFFIAYEDVLWPVDHEPVRRAVFMEEYFQQIKPDLDKGVILFYARGGWRLDKTVYQRAIAAGVAVSQCKVLIDPPGSEGGWWASLAERKGDCVGHHDIHAAGIATHRPYLAKSQRVIG